VKTLLQLAAATAAVLTLSGLASSAQAQKPFGINASKHGIAVVDVSYIFKKHDRFRATMESMKKEMEVTESELKADRDKIQQMEEQRNTYNPGSAEYKQLDEQLARDMAEFNLKMTRLRKSFLEREAKVYYQTYLEVGDAVKYYATRHDIGLVIRFNGEPVDPNRREDVLREINKPVVFQNQIDITADVIDLLNRDAQQNPQIGRPPAPGSSIPR
jgi:Skp family chaperone for outer membrane proteins